MKAIRCPVCNGSGRIRDIPTPVSTSATPNNKPCHGCGGQGWVSEEDEYPTYWPWIPYEPPYVPYPTYTPLDL